MSRRCELTGKGVMSGNNVSHAKNRTRRRFLPNLQQTSMMSDAMGAPVRLRLAASTIRTIEHAGGLDTYLSKTPAAKLTDEGKTLKKKIKKALEGAVA